MKKRVLVFPCGSEIGLEIHNALQFSTHVELYGGSSAPDHGKYVYKNYLETLPFVDDISFIKKLNRLIVTHKIDLIFPAHDSVVLKLAENTSRIKCQIIGSPLRTCEICRSKKKTYQHFKHLFNTPKVYPTTKTVKKFPVFLKPEVGQGTKGTHIAYSLQDIEFYLHQDPTLLILEYLPGEEYTIDCFTDRRGKLRFIGPRKRSRISNGISVNTFPVSIPDLTALAKKINKHLIFRGAWFFQVKKNSSGNFCLLEIAPRIAGSMGLYRNLGINFALLSIFDLLGLDIEIITRNYEIKMDRALFNRFHLDLNYKHVYVDLDDTIIFNNQINPLVMMFLYQCLNRQIKIHLLSRHHPSTVKNLNSTLKRYHLSSLFAEIIAIPKDKDKTTYITKKDSIFIDDSFAERQAVAIKCGIPTFEVSSLESLIDWRY